MEHRCGQRTTIDVPVRLKAWPHIGRGQLRDASVSGAFIETELELPVLGMVDVELRVVQADSCGSRTTATHVVPACIVRADRLGIAIEWFELAPAAITALLAGRLPADHPPRSGSEPGRRPNLLQQGVRDRLAGVSMGRHR